MQPLDAAIARQQFQSVDKLTAIALPSPPAHHDERAKQPVGASALQADIANQAVVIRQAEKQAIRPVEISGRQVAHFKA